MQLNDWTNIIKEKLSPIMGKYSETELSWSEKNLFIYDNDVAKAVKESLEEIIKSRGREKENEPICDKNRMFNYYGCHVPTYLKDDDKNRREEKTVAIYGYKLNGEIKEITLDEYETFRERYDTTVRVDAELVESFWIDPDTNRSVQDFDLSVYFLIWVNPHLDWDYHWPT